VCLLNKHKTAVPHPRQIQTPSSRQAKLQPQHQPLSPSPLNPWLRFAATTGPVKSAQKRQLAVTGDATHVLVSAVRARVLTAARAVAVTVLQTVRHEVISAKNAVHVWAMRPFAPNVRPWSAPKCRCANWPHKRMAKP
jgi:hypothetical protein